MSFNPDTSKQAQEIIFSRKTKKILHPLLHFNNSIVLQTPYQKHLGIFLNAWLIFEEHLKVITTKVNKTIALFAEIAKSFAKIGINDYVQSFCETTFRLWCNLWRSLQRNISPEPSIYSVQCLRNPIESCMRVLSSREKLYHELGLEFPQGWR